MAPASTFVQSNASCQASRRPSGHGFTSILTLASIVGPVFPNARSMRSDPRRIWRQNTLARRSSMQSSSGRGRAILPSRSKGALPAGISAICRPSTKRFGRPLLAQGPGFSTMRWPPRDTEGSPCCPEALTIRAWSLADETGFARRQDRRVGSAPSGVGSRRGLDTHRRREPC